jgi:hypothetical protein
MIKNVNKDNVYALDKIDEAVIDEFRHGISKFGRKVANVTKRVVENIKKFVVDVFNLGGIIAVVDESGKTIKASHPINTIVAAKEYDGINFVPSSITIETCKELGIEPEAVRGYDFIGSYNGAFQGDINESKKDKGFFNSVFEEEYIDPSGKVYNLVDFKTDRITDRLVKMYIGQFKKILPDNATTAVPIIFGAPGIGKSAIIENLKYNIRELGLKDEIGNPIDINVITVNANNVNSETFTMPAQFHQDIRKVGNDNHGPTTTIKDLPKTWLPMYDYLENDDTEETYNDGIDTTTKLMIGNAVANGGGFKKDKNTGKLVLVNGPGGIFFIDEFLRMTQFGKDSLMTIATSRTIGQGLKFGDRWVICAASNRPNDMSSEALEKGFKAELADRTRFALINYVPEPEIWYKWANKINSTGRPNVIPEIVNFIRESQKSKNDLGYFYNAYNFGEDDFGMVQGDKEACVPRTWEATSNTLILNYLQDEEPDVTLIQFLANQTTPELREELLFDIQDDVATHVGKIPAVAFVNFLRSQVESLNPDIAKQLYYKGLNSTDKKTTKYIKDVISFMSVEDWDVFLNESFLPMLINLKVNPTQDGLINIFDIAMFVIGNSKVKSQNVAEMETVLKSTFASIQRSFNINLSGNNNEWAKVTEYYLKLKDTL